MLLGADTLVPVSQDILDLVKERFGTTPLMWGRYFKRPDFAEDFQPAAESAILAANNIRLLPIARQTARVAGSASDGANDAALNVDAYTKALGIDYLAGYVKHLHKVARFVIAEVFERMEKEA